MITINPLLSILLLLLLLLLINLIGAVTFDQIFEYFEETPTLYAREVFLSLDGVDEYGTVEFGDFVRCVGTYCFFGKQELLRFMFVFADKDMKGSITHAQFVTLLNTLNPFDKQRAKRALQELQMIPDKNMEFDQFAAYNDEFPNIMHPAFRLQHAMREKILGNEWWFDKLTKYKNVRWKMTQSGANVDKMAEVSRFDPPGFVPDFLLVLMVKTMLTSVCSLHHQHYHYHHYYYYYHHHYHHHHLHHHHHHHHHNYYYHCFTIAGNATIQRR